MGVVFLGDEGGVWCWFLESHKEGAGYLFLVSWFLLLLVFVFVGRTSHPSLSLVSLLSLVFFLLLIYFSSFLIKKRKKGRSGVL